MFFKNASCHKYTVYSDYIWSKKGGKSEEAPVKQRSQGKEIQSSEILVLVELPSVWDRENHRVVLTLEGK